MSTQDSNADYRRFCATAPDDFPVFMQDWYLDAVCEGGTWQVAISEKHGQIVGVWPYFLKKKGIWRYIAMPKMGKLMGPYVLPAHRKISSETRILQDLITRLPKGLAAFEQDCNYSFQNWMPMYWQGFSQTTRYSYTIDLTSPPEALWAGMDSDYRRKIKIAQENLVVRHDPSIQDLYDVCMLSFTRQNLKIPFSFDYFNKIYMAFEAHHACEKFFALDKKSGKIYSAGYLVWDKNKAYGYMGGDDPEFRSSGSGLLLVWERMKYAQEILQLPTFDFMGSMLKNIEPSRRYFGAVQQPYFRLQREWSPLWKWGKSLLR
jgi:hypothetical protein